MEIVEMTLEAIKPYENNPRKNDEAVEYVANSIKEFGWKQPIVVDKNNVIIAGHTRYKAACKLGLMGAPVLIADDLTPKQVKALRLADNKSAEKAEWNYDLLNEEISNITGIDMEQFGFLDEVDLDIDFDEVAKNEEEGEIEFTKIIGEETNYVVLKFDNEIDWNNALSLFELKKVKTPPNRKDGSVNKKTQHIGLGRVIDGAEAINKIRGV